MGQTIKTYKELNLFYSSFFDRELPFFLLKARGGLGKSFTIEQEQKKGDVNITIFEGKETPLNIYLTLCSRPNDLVVFDDVDELLKNKTIVSLMKQITLNGEERTIRYGSTFKPSQEVLNKYNLNELPPKATINNKVMLITNKEPSGDENLKALLTRGIYIKFEPSNDEVLKIMSKFAKDKEILNFITNYKEVIPLNFRIYSNQLLKLKQAGLDWKKYFLETYKINDVDFLVNDFIRKHKDGLKSKKDTLNFIMNNKGVSKRQAYRLIKDFK